MKATNDKKHTVNAKYDVIALKAIKSRTWFENKNHTKKEKIGSKTIESSL